MATIGVTATLSYEVASDFIAIPGVKKVSFPATSVTSIETTHLGISDYCKTFIPGMIDNGAVAFECEYSEATYSALTDLLREIKNWKVTGPTDSLVTLTFEAFLTKCEVSLEPDAEAMITGELKVTGAVDVT